MADTPSPPVAQEPRNLREAIERFILEERLGPKLEKIDKDIRRMTEEGKHDEARKLQQKREMLLAEGSREAWLASASERASQIEFVTHGVKFTHSAAQGTGVFSPCNRSPATPWLGTHSVARDLKHDVVGNAAALDVHKFLCVKFSGKTILQHVQEDTDELKQAMGEDAEKVKSWAKAFAAVTRASQKPASSTLAKQVFFPVGDAHYHLLGPLFATSLQHSMYSRLQEHLFGERAKVARKARSDDKPHEHGFADYPDLAVQVFGGTKPQNISQLNSERHGEAWLLPSCPPSWRASAVRPPVGVKTVFGRVFGGRQAVRELTRALAEFLAKTDYNNVHIRRARGSMVDQIVDELMQFAAEVQAMVPGWSAAADCVLDQAEALWLDPGRALDDTGFASTRQLGDWQQSIAERFGNWLNAQLRFHSRKRGELKLGEAERDAWKSELEDVLKMLRTEFSDD